MLQALRCIAVPWVAQMSMMARLTSPRWVAVRLTGAALTHRGFKGERKNVRSEMTKKTKGSPMRRYATGSYPE